jgi:phage terminase large subunit-like protein
VTQHGIQRRYVTQSFHVLILSVTVPKLNPAAIDALPEGPNKERAKKLFAQYLQTLKDNPLARFAPHSKAQRDFLAATTRIVAAFCGNQFGKSTILVIRALIEAVPEEFLPAELKAFKRYEPPNHGWLLCPANDKIYDSLFPALRKWCPREALHKGDIDSAYDKQHRVLRFQSGSTISFKTYEMDADKLGGATLHYVGYDEPPPRLHREECITRLLVHGGYEMFAMTPLKVNTGWIRRDIYRKREDPETTVVRGTMHDNPLLSESSKKHILGQYQNDLWRRAREYGDFVDVGGMVYPDAERCVIEPPSAQEIRSWDTVVGIDPGIRNAGFAFVGFDDDGVAVQWGEGMLQDATPDMYANFIRMTLSEKGIDVDDVTFVIDPAARARSQVNAETVQTALSREGINCLEGQNDVEAGVMQVRSRMAHGRWKIASDCRITRDTLDTYAAEDREDGKFVPIKDGTEHIADAFRYVAMTRPFYPQVEEEAPERRLGWEPNTALDVSSLRRPALVGPLGEMS